MELDLRDTDTGALTLDVDELIPEDLGGFNFDDATLFLERIAAGWGEHEAGLARPLNWSQLKIRQFCALPGIQDLIFSIKEAENESVERAVLYTARRGNPASQKLWLFNRAPHRGWADRKTVKMEGEVDHNLVVSVKQALDEQTRELVASQDAAGIAALQQSIGLGMDDDIIDAEVIDS